MQLVTLNFCDRLWSQISLIDIRNSFSELFVSMYCQTVILTYSGKAGLKFVTEMLFNKHCYFFVILEFYFKYHLGVILFILCFISHMDLMISLLDSYKYFECICWLVLLEKTFPWISVYLLLFTANQFAHTKEKCQLNVRMEANPTTHA